MAIDRFQSQLEDNYERYLKEIVDLQNSQMKDVILSADPDSVVDLGCGLGKNLASMMQIKSLVENTRYIGVDYSRDMLHHC